MRNILFLLIIYATYIALGLPDSILGVAWPSMVGDFSVSYSAVGIISMTIAICTVISSLQTVHITQKIGTGKLVFISVLFTVIGLIGFAYTHNFYLLIFAALPLGFGAGAIDTAVNDYVASNLKAHHMNWLHAFWGIGATLGSVTMGIVLKEQYSWRTGYILIACVLFVLAIILLFSIGKWKDSQQKEVVSSNESKASTISLVKQKRVILALLSFIVYVGLEGTIFLWGSTFIVEAKSLTIVTASFIISIFFASLTIGRIIAGFITFKLSNQKLLFISEAILIFGIILVACSQGLLLYAGFILLGLGCAAIFPTMIHETPRRFGEKNSGAIIGFQVASGYIGITIIPPILGVIFQNVTMNLFPIFLIIFALLLFVATILIEKGKVIAD